MSQQHFSHEPPDSDFHRQKQADIEQWCDRYVSFWFFVCLAALFLIGWPALLAWGGLAWGMKLFRQILFGDED